MGWSASQQGKTHRPSAGVNWKTKAEWEMYDLERNTKQDIGGIRHDNEQQQNKINTLQSQISSLEKANKDRDAAAAKPPTSEDDERRAYAQPYPDSDEITHSDSITNAKDLVNQYKNGKTDETDASEVAKTGNNTSASTEEAAVFTNFSGDQTASDQPKKDPQEFADKYKLTLSSGLNLT